MLALSHVEVDGVRVKVQLEDNFPALYTAKRAQTNSSCSDIVPVSHSKLTLYGNLKKLGTSVKFWRSNIARDNLALFSDMKVPGLKGETVEQVFDTLRRGNCYPYYIGGAVRDQFLNRTPNDADVEVDCSMAAFAKLCLEKWGKNNCHYVQNRPVAHIGNTTVDKDLEVMDIASTNSTFYVPLYQLEYTVNAMAYDTNGNDVIIDLSGNGTFDACHRHIRIPSTDNAVASWNKWLESTHAVYRFWKLRTKGLTAIDGATLKFVVEAAKREMEESPLSFPKFYCTYVFGGKYNPDLNKCNIDKAKCKAGVANMGLYDKVLTQDLGAFWTNVTSIDYLPNLMDCNIQGPHPSGVHKVL